MRRIAVLTGATGGIGKEIARLLIGQGYQVHALVRRPEALGAVCPGHGDALVGVPCDLSDGGQVRQAAEIIAALDRPVQILVHCAGSIHPEEVTDIEEATLAYQMAINLTAPILLTSRLAGRIARGGHVVFVNSMAGVLPLQGNSVYSATKFGLRGFARSISLDFQPRDIRVSSIFPGAVDTPMLMQEMQDGGSALNFVSTPIEPRVLAELVVRCCSGRGGEFFRPKMDGVFSHACLMMPWLLRLALPLLERLGTLGQRRFLSRKAET